ncbi:hypothetical protein TWF281_007577 [Arthrobotrys megalospora]
MSRLPDAASESDYTRNGPAELDIEHHAVGEAGLHVDHGNCADAEYPKDENSRLNPTAASMNTVYAHKLQTQNKPAKSTLRSTSSLKDPRLYGRGPSSIDVCRCPKRCTVHPPAVVDLEDGSPDAEGEKVGNPEA